MYMELFKYYIVKHDIPQSIELLPGILTDQLTRFDDEVKMSWGLNEDITCSHGKFIIQFFVQIFY